MYKIQKDRYRTARGGRSRIFDVRCAGCGNHITFYQKDGPGVLKRMYLDRCIDIDNTSDQLTCSACGRVLGIKIIYHKEKRTTFRLFVGSVSKKIVSAKYLNSATSSEA